MVPAGRWGVAVSGGADSMALLHTMLRDGSTPRTLVVLHVDHATRGEGSALDARFVHDHVVSLGLGVAQARLADGPAKEAAWRAARIERFAHWSAEHELDGVLLAHHADDVAETVAMRLLRGSARSGTAGLTPLRRRSQIRGLLLIRPLLQVRRAKLRRFLRRIGVSWREDVTNAQPTTLRNRIRGELMHAPGAADSLLQLNEDAQRAETWLRSQTPAWPNPVRLASVHAAPMPLRRRAARQWLRNAGVTEAEATPGTVDRLLAIADAAGPTSAQFAGGVRVWRRGGSLQSEAR